MIDTFRNEFWFGMTKVLYRLVKISSWLISIFPCRLSYDQYYKICDIHANICNAHIRSTKKRWPRPGDEPYSHQGKKNRASHFSSMGFIWGTTWHRTKHPIDMDTEVVVCPHYFPNVDFLVSDGCFFARVEGKRQNKTSGHYEYWIADNYGNADWFLQSEVAVLGR